MNKNILTVCIITYNHEKYIEQALESVLMQKTNFEWDIIIADDCSKDNTRLILDKFKKIYPEKINFIYQKNNVGPAQNFIDLINFPKSKYIAYLEGDDYWLDENKLQKQVDFLENNLDYTLIHGNVVGLQNNQEIFPIPYKNWNYKTDTLEFKDTLSKPIAFSGTVMFRNFQIKKYLNNVYKNLIAGDWGFWVILTNNGKAKFLNEKLAVYRMGVGVSNNFNFKKDYLTRTVFLMKNSLKFKNKTLCLKFAFYYFKKYLKA